MTSQTLDCRTREKFGRPLILLRLARHRAVHGLYQLRKFCGFGVASPPEPLPQLNRPRKASSKNYGELRHE
jgi:hypothetical protein